MGERESERAHVHSLPSDFIDVQSKSYDPDYISDISKKMQVPDRISVGDGMAVRVNNGYYDPLLREKQLTQMTVPERIIVAGDNQHIGLREGLRKLPIDGDIPSYHSNIVELATPPHVLTLEQSFPVVDEADEKTEHPSVVSFDSSKHIGASMSYIPGKSPHDSVLYNEEDEGTSLKTQIGKLTRRIAVIEEDNQRRAQRELILYPAIMSYILWKILSWFFRSR